MTIPQERREELRRLAEEATPGPWEVAPTTAWGDEYVELAMQPVTESWDSDPAHACCEPLSPADAEFIAAANPDAIRELLDALDQAEARIKAVRDVLDIAASRVAYDTRYAVTSNRLDVIIDGADIRRALEG